MVYEYLSSNSARFMKKTLLLIGLIFVAIIPALIGIFHPGFFVSDDGNWMVIRLSAFFETLRHGQFPVRFLPRLNGGFGYPVADFLYPLFLYIGPIIHIFHIPFVMTLKILFGASLLIGFIGTFIWLRKQFGNVGAFVSALIYTLFPYHIWDITKRGSIGEVLAMGILPFIFWQIDIGNSFFVGLGIALLILAHNTLALLFLPVIAGYFILLKKYKKGIISIILGLGLSAFFWFPALFDKQYTVFDKTIISTFSQYFLSNNLYTLIGIISFVVIAFSLFLLFKKPENRAAFFMVITLLSISLTTQISTFIWQALHLGIYVQFPFRFLSVTTLGIAFLAGFSIKNWKKGENIVVAVLLVILLYISSWQYFFPKTYQYFPDTFYSTNQDSTTVHNEYMPIWVSKLPLSSERISFPHGIITNLTDNGNALSFQTTATISSQITISTIYFPGWMGKIDGQKIAIAPAHDTGFITADVASGTHQVKIWFGETPIRFLADAVSLITIIVSVGIILYKKKKKL